MAIVKVCSTWGKRRTFPGCGRIYSLAEFVQLRKRGVAGVRGEFTTCRCGSVLFEEIEEDPMHCSACGSAKVKGACPACATTHAQAS